MATATTLKHIQMNTPKIVGLYQAVKYDMYHRWASRLDQVEAQTLLNELDYRVRRIVYNEFVADGDLVHRVSIRDTKPVSGKLDFFGDKQYYLVDTKCTPRVYAWAKQQLPVADDYEVDPKDRYMAAVGTYQGEQGWEMHIRVGGEPGFAALSRGMLSFQRKRQKYTHKILAQLRAYHEQQLHEAKLNELRQLGRGHWLGADKALTSAARTYESTISYMGDAGLTDEQERELRYWRVPEGQEMGTALPAGTGVALKVITSHKQLIDGAIYLSQVTLHAHKDEAQRDYVMTIGRLDKSRKQYGVIPIFKDDAPERNLYINAEWRPKREGQRYEALLMQVVYYTTRAAEAPVGVELPRPVMKDAQELAQAA